MKERNPQKENEFLDKHWNEMKLLFFENRDKIGRIIIDIDENFNPENLRFVEGNFNESLFQPINTEEQIKDFDPNYAITGYYVFNWEYRKTTICAKYLHCIKDLGNGRFKIDNQIFRYKKPGDVAGLN